MANQGEVDKKIQDRLDEAAAAKAEAGSPQAAAKAEQAETDADASRYGALVPDLSKVNTDTLDLKGDNATMANALVFAALTDAATLVATKIGERVGDGVKSMHVLVTNEVDLFQGSTTYLNLTRELEQLKDQAYAVIKQPSKAFTAGLIGVGSALALGSALASAVPGALSLFAHHETLTRTAPKTTTWPRQVQLRTLSSGAKSARLSTTPSALRGRAL